MTVAAASASALLLWASSPAVGAGWLAWVALVPVAIVALRQHGSRRGRLAVPLAYVLYLELLLVPSLPFGLAHNQWAKPIAPILVGDSPVVLAAVVAIPLFGLALYAVRFPHVLPGARTAGLTAVLVPALSWTALDLLRVKFDPSGLWGPLFLSQHDTRAAGLAALGGPWLVTFAVVALNYAVAALVVHRRALLPRVATAGVLAVLPLAGIVVLENRGAAGSDRLGVAAVQPGYDTAEFGLPVLHYLRRAHRNHELATRDLIRDLAPLTRRAARLGAGIVVWPEATAWVEPHRVASARRALTALARETQATLVVPYFIRSRGQGAAVAVLPNGFVTRPQPKQRPMWFVGERGGNGEPGEPVEAGGLMLGTLLGVDNQDAAPARRLASRGAELITSSTHDWEQLAPQQLAFAQLHARALQVPLVRADWRYGSAIFAPDGRKAAEAAPGKRRAVVVAEVAPGGGATPYARVGDQLGWAALAAVAALFLGRRLIARRAFGPLRRRASAG